MCSYICIDIVVGRVTKAFTGVLITQCLANNIPRTKCWVLCNRGLTQLTHRSRVTRKVAFKREHQGIICITNKQTQSIQVVDVTLRWLHTQLVVCSLMTTNWRPGLAKHWLKTYVLLPLILTLEYNFCWVKIQHYWTKMKFYSK